MPSSCGFELQIAQVMDYGFHIPSIRARFALWMRTNRETCISAANCKQLHSLSPARGNCGI